MDSQQESNNIKTKKLRTCRFGAGEEKTYGKYDTEGFKLLTEPNISITIRGYKTIHLKRNHNRILQTSTNLLQAWRANCDIQIILYDTDPKNIDSTEITKVVDYIVGYACKANEKIKDEKEQLQSIITK